MIECTELEDKITVEQRALNPLDLAFADSAEGSITAHDIVAKSDADIVQCRRVRGPEIWAICLESKCRVGAATVACDLVAV